MASQDDAMAPWGRDRHEPPMAAPPEFDTRTADRAPTRRPQQPRRVVIDDGGQLPIVGSEWTRRHPAGDEWDHIVLRGVFALPPDRGETELCVAPKSFGPVMTTTAKSLFEHYKRYTPDDPSERAHESVDRLTARLAALESQVRS